MSTIDLNQPPAGHKFDVSIEKEESAGEIKVRLFKEVTLFVVALMMLGAIVAYCFYITAFSAVSTADEKKWAMTVLGAAGGGLLGYLVKK